MTTGNEAGEMLHPSAHHCQHGRNNSHIVRPTIFGVNQPFVRSFRNPKHACVPKEIKYMVKIPAKKNKDSKGRLEKSVERDTGS